MADKLKRAFVSLLAIAAVLAGIGTPATAGTAALPAPSYAAPSHVRFIPDGQRKPNSKLLLTCPPDCYWYGQDSATVASSTSANGNFTSWKPTLGSDAHSLAELAVANAGQTDIVEVGWTVSATTCGSIANSPCLFVYHWVNGAATCYNGCGWVDNSAVALNAGSTLSVSGGTAATLKTYKFGIRQVASSSICGAGSPGGWLVSAWLSTGTTQDIGCFPNSLWTSPTFTSFTRILGFGEVAGSSATPTAQMGSGLCGTVANVNTTGFIGSLQTNLGLIAGTWSATDSTKYSVSSLSGSSGYYGGDTTCP